MKKILALFALTIVLVCGCSQIDRNEFEKMRREVDRLAGNRGESLLIAKLMVHLSLFKAERADLATQFIESHVKVSAIDAQIKALTKEIADLKKEISERGEDLDQARISSHVIFELSYHISILKTELAKLNALYAKESPNVKGLSAKIAFLITEKKSIGKDRSD